MNILNRKKRILILIILTTAVAVMVIFNVTGYSDGGSYTNKLNIIALIFFTALALLLYIIYEAYTVMYNEMTERVNTITANKDDLQTVYNSIFLHLIEVNDQGIIINVNDYVCQYLNRKRNHILGKTVPKLFSMEPEVTETLNQVISSAFEKKEKVFDEFETRGNIFEASVSVLQDLPESEIKVLLVLDDVTQKRANYKQMLQDNKMIAVGQLAAGVAHEIRNPLGLIRTYSHLLKKNPDDLEIREQALNMIDYSVDRSSGIINNLLGFSRLSGDTWEEINLKTAIDAMIMLEEHKFHDKKIDISINCPEDLDIYTIAESLQIILVNLINNAVDAIGEDGSIYIICKKTEENLVITVRDSGVGIPKNIQSDIFNPFFTTKSNINGSGLGLYIVYSEVQKLKGKIEVESVEGVGTSFIVTL